MAATLPRPRVSRETRLLVATIAISAATLLALAWFRFPESPAADPGQPREQPLERLAARAAYDELNAIVARVAALVAPGVVVLRASHDPANTAVTDPLPAPRLVVGLRLGEGLVVAAVPGTALVEQYGERWTQVAMVATDPIRGISVLRVPAGGDETSLLAAGRVAPSPATPAYAMAIEGSPRGPAARPVFVGRLDPAPRPGWRRGWFVPPVLAPSGPGVVVVDLEGRAIGMTVGSLDHPVLAPIADVVDASRRLLSEGPPEAGDLGVEVASLSARLMEATGSARGAVVTAVRRDGPSAGVLQPTDVIERIGDTPVRSARDLSDAARAAAPGAAVALAIRRDGQERVVTVTVGSAETIAGAHEVPSDRQTGEPAALGLVLRPEPGGGSRVTAVGPRSAASEAGFAGGDVITWFAGTDAPSPPQVRKIFASAARGAHVLVAIDRAGTHHVLALEKR